jgi:hypothetical protein
MIANPTWPSFDWSDTTDTVTNAAGTQCVNHHIVMALYTR